MLDRQSSTVLLALSLALGPSLTVCTQTAKAAELPITTQTPTVSARQGSSAFSPQRLAPRPENLIQGDNLSAAQLSQIFGSGPRVFSIQTSSPISGDVLIPRGITLINLVSLSSTGLNIQGNLVTSGKLIFSSTDTAASLASLSANNVTISPGGLISSTGNLSLNINAVSSIVNSGTISSAGNLNITAGGAITNASPASYAVPLMQAMQNINLTSAIGSFTNSGLINAIGGNVNIAATTASQSINFNNLLGTVQANNAINFRDASYSGSANIDIRGGNWVSQVLNLESGKGTIDAFVDDISGVVNATACNAHIGTFESKTLNLGNLNVSGDPTYFNTGGDLLVTGDISTGGAALAFLASGNVSLTGATISTNSLSGDGGNLLVVAGADLTPSNVFNDTGDTTTVITINNGPGSGGGSIIGGNITIDGSITTTGGAGGDGGTVQLIAYSGISHAGTIQVGGGIATGGNSSGKNGNVTIISGAPAAFDDGITVGSISTTGSTDLNPGGTIVLSVASPTISSAPINVLDGVQSGGTFIAGTFQNGNIVTNGALTTKSSGVQLATGGNVTIGGNITTTGTNFTGGSIAILSGGNISTSAGGAPFSFDTSTTVSNAGSLNLIAGAALQTGSSANQVLVTGSSSSGGSVNFSSSGGNAGVTFLSNTNVNGTFSGAARVIAMAGATLGSGTVDWNAGAASITTGSSNGGKSGGAIITAGATSGTSINMGVINTRNTNGESTSGAITINTASTIVPANITFNNGSLSSGSFAVGTSQPASVVVGRLESPGGAVSINSGKDITLNGSIEVLHVFGKPSVSLQAPNGILTTQGGSTGQILMQEQFLSIANGGTVNITAKDIVVSGTGAFEIHAEAKGNGAGGIVSITQTNAKSLTIGSASGASNIAVFATGGTDGGKVTLSSGGNLIVDTSSLAFNGNGSGFGSQLSLTAGTAGDGLFQINNSLSATGTAAILTLVSNSATPFAINGLSGNFVQGTLSANSAGFNNGGTVTVKNLGNGGIVLGNASDIIVNSAFNALPSTITLETAGDITIGAGKLSVDADGFNGGGTLTIRAGNDLILPASGLTLSAANKQFSGDYGTILLSHGSSGNVVFDSGNFLAAENVTFIATNGGYTTPGSNNVFARSFAFVQKASIDASTINGLQAEEDFRLTMVSTGGDVGASANRLNIFRTDFTAQAAKGVFITNTQFGEGNVNLVETTVDGTLYKNSAGTTFSVIASGLSGGEVLATGGGVNITADKVELQSSTGVSLGGNVTATSSIGIIQNNSLLNGSYNTLSAPEVALVVEGAGANLGVSTSNRLQVNAATFTGHSKSGSVFVDNTSTGSIVGGNVTLADSTINGVTYKNSAKSTYSVLASGVANDVLSTGDISGVDVTITSAGGINMGSTSTATNQLAFVAAGNISSVGSTSTPMLTVATTALGASIGSSSSRVSINAPIFTVSAGEAAWITNLSTGDLNGDVVLDKSTVEGVNYFNKADATFSVHANNISSGKSLKVSDSINATDIALKSSGGVTVSAAVNGSGSAAIISNDSIVNSTGSINAAQLTLVVTGSSSNIGVSSLDRLSVNAASLTLSSKSGSVFVENTSTGDKNGNVNLQDSVVESVTYKNSAAATYSLDNQGIASGKNTVSQGGVTVSAQDIDLTSSGGFALNGSIAGSKTAALISTDSITATGSLSAPSVTLATTGVGSSIGVDANNRVTISAPDFTASATGSVFLTNTSTGDINGNVKLVNSTVNGNFYSNGASGDYSVNATGIAAGKNIVTVSNLSAGNVVLNSSGGINIGAGGLNASGMIALISKDSITNANIGGTLTSSRIVLAATGSGSSIGTSLLQPFVLDDIEFVAASANASVFIRDNRSSGDITLDNTMVEGGTYSNTAGSTYSFRAPNLNTLNTHIKSNVGSDVTAQDISFNSAGGISLAGGLVSSASPSTVSLVAQRSITTLGPTNTDQITLVVTGASQNIGVNDGNRLQVTAKNLTASASIGSVFINNTISNSSFNIVDSVVEGAPYTNNASNFYSIYAPNLGVGNNIVVATGVTINSNSTIELIAGEVLGGGVKNDGTLKSSFQVGIMSSDTITSIGNVISPRAILVATGANSNIGTNATTGRVFVDAQNLCLNAVNGSVFVTDTYNSGTVGFVPGFIHGIPINNSANPATGTYDLATAGSLDATSTITQGNAITLSSVGGGIKVGNSNLFGVDYTFNCPNGTLEITDNTLAPNTTSTPFDRGGSVIINANSILGSSITPSPVTINASGLVGGFGEGGTISITVPSGLTIGTNQFNLVLKADGGTFALATGKGGSISLTTGGVSTDVDLSAISVKSSTAGGGGGTVIINTSGTLNLTNSSTLDVSASVSGDGGQILFQAKSIVSTLGQPFTLTADGAGSGNGGKITVSSLDGATPLVVDSGNGNFTLSAKSGGTGGNGGIISVSSGQNLTFNSAALTANPNAAGNGNGAQVSMIANGVLNLMNSSYTYNGAGNGNGGLIHFEGNSISTVGPTALTASGSGTGNGGKVQYVVNGSTADVVLDQATGLKIVANGGTAFSLAGDGGTVDVITTGAIKIDSSGLSAGPLGLHGKGAKLNFFGSSVSKLGGGLLTLSASGGGSDGSGIGDGGSITINQNMTSSQSIGSSATNNFKLVANAGMGGGNGGSVLLSTGGNLTVDPSGISILASSPGNQVAHGGSIFLKTSNGNLLVTGALSANSAGTNISSVGGSITLESSSKTAFSIKTGSTNGTKGDLSVTGIASNGSILIQNNGGGVTDAQATMAANTITFISGNNGPILVNGTLAAGTVALTANGSGNITASKMIQSAAVNAQSGTGNISMTNINLLNPAAVSANTAGTVTVTGTVVSPQVPSLLSISGATGKTITVKTPGSIMVSGAVTGTTAVTLQSTSKSASNAIFSTQPISSSGTLKVEAPTVNLSSNLSSVGNMTITSKLGNLSIGSGVQLSAGVLAGGAPTSPLPLVSANITKAGSITLTSAGTSVNALVTGNGSKIISNGAGITLKTTVAGAGLILGDGEVTANGGAISISSKGVVQVGNLLNNGATILARSLNNGTGTVSISGTGITVGAKSSISANKAVTMTASDAKSSFDIGANAKLQSGFGSSTTAGALTITANGTGTGSLQIGADTNLIANAGVLKVTAKGDLTIGTNANLSGSSVTATSAGDAFTVADSVSIAATASKSGNITLSMSKTTTGSTPVISVGDDFDFNTVSGNLTITGKAGGVSLGVSGGPFGGHLTAGGSTSIISITSTGNNTVGVANLDAGKSVTITAPKGTLELDGTGIGDLIVPAIISLSGQNKLTLKGGAELKSSNNLTATAVSTTADLIIGDNVHLTAGKLNGADPLAAFSSTLVQSKGSVLLTGGSKVSFGDNNVLTSNGGDIKVIAKASDMQVGSTGLSGNQFFAYGGNIQMLAKGTVTGANKNSFTAFSMGAASPLSNSGGGIELGSGLISSTALNTAFGSKTVPNPPASAVPPGIIGAPTVSNSNGVIAVNNKSGNPNPINLTGSTLNFLPTFQGGVQVFDAATSGSKVDMQGATFTTSAFKPIAMTTVEVAVEEESFSPGEPLLLRKNVALVYATPKTRVLQTEAGNLNLRSGEIFVSASDCVSIVTEHAEVQASKGALVGIKQFQGNTYVRACSEGGTVSVQVEDRTIALNPGEEITIADHKLDKSEIYLADGLGRRHSKTGTIGQKHICVTEFAIITLLSSSDTISDIRRSNSSSSKQLINRMLKTAATIDMVLKHRGAYSAN